MAQRGRKPGDTLGGGESTSGQAGEGRVSRGFNVKDKGNITYRFVPDTEIHIIPGVTGLPRLEVNKAEILGYHVWR